MIRVRAEHEMSRRELAERFGLTLVQVADMEVGDVTPERDVVERVASLLGIDLKISPCPS